MLNDKMVLGCFFESGVMVARVVSPAGRTEKRLRRVHHKGGCHFIRYHGERACVSAGYIAVAEAARRRCQY